MSLRERINGQNSGTVGSGPLTLAHLEEFWKEILTSSSEMDRRIMAMFTEGTPENKAMVVFCNFCHYDGDDAERLAAEHYCLECHCPADTTP